MEYIDQDNFSDDQKWIIEMRVNERLSYRQIQAAWKAANLNSEYENISPAAIRTCFKRSALSLYWEKGKLYGNEPFLSDYDINVLQNYIKDRTKDSEPVDSFELIEEAVSIRKDRNKRAVNFLKAIKCDNIADEIEQSEINEPVRSWINKHLEDLDSKIKSARIVDNDRYYACTPDILNSYLSVIGPILTRAHPALIFGADETHLDPKIKKKFIVPNHIREFMAKREPTTIPHFSVMLCHNCLGISITPFIIIPELENCPQEAKKYIESGQLWACSSNSGWQNRNSFLIWSLNFINWLSCYRLGLDEEIRNERAVLILDGHNSRENPISLHFFTLFNIDVIILPAHTTHLLQMFDVVLARKFKKNLVINLVNCLLIVKLSIPILWPVPYVIAFSDH
ncbi:hypothetical protein M9Y10_034029 [Tritrichomonas musculus]|uniref:DDE-1 domain-containing protein n=1 Tax=Tritrichomonas musculus TaxID=1915356 RepID=A0ABR2KDS0_9EUKA